MLNRILLGVLCVLFTVLFVFFTFAYFATRDTTAIQVLLVFALLAFMTGRRLFDKN
jgi:hypothetical protein